MGRNLKILLSILSVTLLYGVYYWGIPAVINLPKRADLVEKIVFEQTGYRIKLENPDLKTGLIPSIWLSANNFAVINDDKSIALDISNPKINIRLLPLILKNIDIKQFSANKIDANLVYDKDKNFRLGQYKIENLPESDLKLHRASVNIADYNINLFDEFQNKNLKLDGQYLTVKDFTADKHIDLSTIADFYSGTKKSYIKTDLNLKLPVTNISDNQIDIDGHIVNLDLSDFAQYAGQLSDNQIKSLSGIINLTAKTTNEENRKQINFYTSIKNLGIFKDDIKSSIHSSGKLELSGDISTINDGIKINDFKIKSEGVNAFVTGKVTKLNAKLPVLDVKVGVTNSKAEKIIPLLPGEPDLDPDINLLKLKQTDFAGNAKAYLEIKGKADYPNVYGNVLVTDAYMVKPIKNAEKATIKLGFKGEKFDLDVRVPTSPTQTVWVKGPINLDKDRSADLHITSTDNVDLKTAQIVLNPLHEILRFEMGPVPIMDIKGKGGIDLRVMGTKINPHAWGKFWFNNATVSFLDIHNLEILNGSGDLKFDNQDTVFESKTATLNGSPISIKGTCTLLGNLNFNVISNNQDLGKLLKTIQTSPMLKDVQQLVKPLKSANGKANVNLNLTGTVKDVNNIAFNKNLFAKGTIELLSNTIGLNDLPAPITKAIGKIRFDNLNADFDLKSNIINSQIKIDGKIKNDTINVKLSSNKFNLGDGIKSLPVKIPYANDISTINSSFSAKYNGKIDNIEYDKINLKGKIYSNKGAKSSIIVNNSTFELNNSNFKLADLRGKFKDSPYNLTLNISRLFSKTPIINGGGKISSFDLNTLNDKTLQNILPSEIKKQLSETEFINGNIDISMRARNNNFNVYTVLDDIGLNYKPTSTKILLNSGNILLQNDTLNLNKINAQIGQSPIFINGKIYNVQKNPNLNIYLNAKPTQDLFDEFFNKNSIYPIKLKGDAILTSKINGTLKNLNAKSTFDIKENSSLYYMGATIGDVENPVKITVDNTYSPNKVKINDLQYDKIILSQNNKPFVKTQLNASGTLNLLSDNNVGFNNFRIKTQNPTDAKIFNIIFRKPFMKQGVFTSNIVLNGTSLNPKIIGKLDITSIDIPFFDSTIRDINLNFKNDKIFITSRGTVLTNDVNIDAVMKNRLAPPYILDNIKIKLADLNINKITDTMTDIEAEATKNPTLHQTSKPFDISQVIINNSEIQADKIKVRNINADNFKANLRITNKQLIDINKFGFDIAEGKVLGSFKHDMSKEQSTLDIHLNNANAAIMSEALFDLKGQVFGSVNGDFNLVCKGHSNEDCFKTLSGEGTFKIANGRMPKLGSLEYLLKAGNLFKSGITGLSINGLVDLVTPLKTGDFQSISGDVHIANGIADKINIYSSGHDLNMYMTGNYDIVTSIADMQLLGSLSKNITTVFGKIKNASLNTLFNTIPGINDSTEKLLLRENIAKIPNIKNATDIYRIFTVEINGDINGNDYVRSFRWVK